jgi:uncharacterized protein YbgA (DUF1722 family)/uncharacterized protein YbbK (DUF523 family)
MKPKILISSCLGFEKCRYNGDIVNFELLDMMKEYIDFIPICPEVAIGLTIPRDSLRIIKEGDEYRLIQPSTKIDFTNEMKAYAEKISKETKDIDGIILKGRSPSCGIKDVKVYSGLVNSPVIEKSKGIFAKEMINNFYYLPIEEEGRLLNLEIREHFFTKLYLLFKYKNVKNQNSIKALSDFHANNKYLYFAYDQMHKNKLGQIVANHERKQLSEVYDEYFQELIKLLSKLPSKKNYINAYFHIFGYFSKNIKREERKFFLDLIEKFKKNQIDKSSIANVLRSYVIKFNIDYLLNQSIFNPFPEGLVTLKDSSIK